MRFGAGGMGEVYRARDTKLGLLVPSSGQFSTTARPNGYDVAPDGKQFLVFQRDSATPNVQNVPNVIVNWFQELNAVR